MSRRAGPGCWRNSNDSTNNADTICIDSTVSPRPRPAVAEVLAGLEVVRRGQIGYDLYRPDRKDDRWHSRCPSSRTRRRRWSRTSRPRRSSTTTASTTRRTSTRSTRWSRAPTTENASLEDIILKAEGKLFNQAAQVWNHTCTGSSMAPGRRRCADRRRRRRGQRRLRRLRRVPRPVQDVRHGPVRLGLGVAHPRRRQARHLGDRQRRPADEARPDRRAHVRRVGARLLHRLPQRRPDYVDAFLDHLINWKLARGRPRLTSIDLD